MVQAQNRWRPVRGSLVGLLVGLTVLSGCRPTGRRALLEGDRQLQAGKPAEAVPFLERAASDLQTDGAAWNHLGRAYHEMGRAVDARKAYLRALQTDRNLFDAHFNLGQLSLETGAWRDAEAGFRTWLGVGQNANAGANAAVAWRGLGMAQFRQSSFNDAERSFGSALRLNAQDAESWNAVGLIRLQRRQYRDAFSTFTHAARIDPRFAAPRLNAAVVAHQHLNDRRAALEYYRAYLAFNPPDAAAITQLIAQLEGHNGAVVPTVDPTAGTKEIAAQSKPTRAIPTPAVAPAPAPAMPSAPVATAVPPPSLPTPTVARPEVSPRLAPPATIPAAPLATTRPPERLPSAVDRTGPTTTSPPDRPINITTSPDRPAATIASNPLPKPSVATRPESPEPTVVSSPAVPSVDPKPVPSPGDIAPIAVVASTTTPVKVDPVNAAPAVQPAPDPAGTTAAVPSPEPAPTLSNLPPAESDSSRAGGVALESATRPSEADPDSARRGLWSRANPVNWFKRDRSPASAPASKPITPLDFPPESSRPTAPARVSQPVPSPELIPSRPVQLAASPAASAAPVSTPAVKPTAARPSRPKPNFPRYQRQIAAAPPAGDRAEAQKEFQRALEAHRRGDLPAAVNGYEQAVRLDPAHFEAQHNLALAAVAQDNLPVALRAAETASVLRPGDPGARFQFAVALQKDRHPEDAVVELEEVARLESNNTASHLAAAMIYANDLDQPESARRHYEKVLALEPGHPQAPAIRRWLLNHPER